MLDFITANKTREQRCIYIGEHGANVIRGWVNYANMVVTLCK